MPLIDYAKQAFVTVRVCKLFHDFGLIDRIAHNYPIDSDFEYTAIYEGLQNVSSFVFADGDDYGNSKFYFSDSAMMEYYRLCREYCNRFGVSLKKNPYMDKAGEYVHNTLNMVEGDFGYVLQTKINHKWASGIVMGWPEYFYGYLELIEALLLIFDFYRTELSALKAELQQSSAIVESKTKEAA